ncbi:MAG: aminotransferase class V-fold PLP-dependent enzyme [Acidobacteriota bacterium]
MDESVPLEMSPDEFRRLGHQLVDRIAALLAGIRQLPVTSGETPTQVRSVLGAGGLPEQGSSATELLDETWRYLVGHSLFNGHPRFAGYVTSSAAPIGVLADLLASALNPNCGAWILSPAATEVEVQTIRWIAEFIGYPSSCGGLLVSGGNMANFVGFMAARKAKAGWDIRADGLTGTLAKRLLVYASTETHTWIHKATDLAGLGTNSIRWIPVDDSLRIRTSVLRTTIEADLESEAQPFLIVGSAGTVSTGAVDALPELAKIARDFGLWFHVDGAYGAPAAALPGTPADLRGLAEADSLAVDPHKWFYAPLEAGCALVRNPQHLVDTYDYSPEYYRFDADSEERAINFYAYGPQNSRGFRALKVWLALKVAGREGLKRMIARDILMARALYREVQEHSELEALSQELSITTFRYVPVDLDRGDPSVAEYLNRLNEQLLDRIQKSGEAFLSNAVVHGKFALRACIVNFRTTMADVEAIPRIVIKLGAECDRAQRRPERA